MNFLELPDGRIAYRVSGPETGRLIVLVHGMGLNGDSYRFLTPLLVDAGYRVASLDVRGHGSSSVPWPDYVPHSVGEDVAALIRELGGPAVVMGNSSGAAAAMWVAGRHPELVSALVIESGFFTEASIPWYLVPAMAVITHLPAAWRAYYGSLFRSRKPDDFAEYAARMTKSLREAGRMAALRGSAGDKADCVALLPQITAPTLVIAGSKDPDFPDPAAEAQRFIDAAHSAAWTGLTIVESAGHYPHAEFPVETAAAIHGLLERTLRG